MGICNRIEWKVGIAKFWADAIKNQWGDGWMNGWLDGWIGGWMGGLKAILRMTYIKKKNFGTILSLPVDSKIDLQIIKF